MKQSCPLYLAIKWFFNHSCKKIRQSFVQSYTHSISHLTWNSWITNKALTSYASKSQKWNEMKVHLKVLTINSLTKATVLILLNNSPKELLCICSTKEMKLKTIPLEMVFNLIWYEPCEHTASFFITNLLRCNQIRKLAEEDFNIIEISIFTYRAANNLSSTISFVHRCMLLCGKACVRPPISIFLVRSLVRWRSHIKLNRCCFSCLKV